MLSHERQPHSSFGSVANSSASGANPTQLFGVPVYLETASGDLALLRNTRRPGLLFFVALATALACWTQCERTSMKIGEPTSIPVRYYEWCQAVLGHGCNLSKRN